MNNSPIKFNDNELLVNIIRTKIKLNDGYCPCKVVKNEDTRCMCKEFRDQIADPNFEGYCHCMLYYKSKDNRK